MASKRPAPPGWKEVRAVWLPPEEWAKLERAVKRAGTSRADYARTALMDRVERDLSPRLPDLEDVRQKMKGYPEHVQRMVLDLVAACLDASSRD